MSRKSRYTIDFAISPNFNASQWRALDLQDEDSKDWPTAVNIFRDRISGRFLKPIEAIENHEDIEIALFSGFAIMALDCLIIETLNQFYCGSNETRGKHEDAFWEFFKSSTRFNEFDEPKARVFYSHYRCGLLHQAQTKKQSKIRIDGNNMVVFVDNNKPRLGLIVNRVLFHKALCEEIEDYAKHLLNPADKQECKSRKNFVKKMQYIAK